MKLMTVKQARLNDEKFGYPYATRLLKTHRLDKNFVNHILSQPKAFDISFTTRCALKCPYCLNSMFKPSVQRRTEMVDSIGVERYIKNLKVLIEPYVPANISFAGAGEATQSEHFVKITSEMLAMGNNILISTNLYHSEHLETLLKNCSDEESKRIFIIFSYHLGACLERKNGKELRRELLKNYAKIASYGHIYQITTPLTPEVLVDKVFERDLEYFETLHPSPSKLQLDLRELVGKYKGLRYPLAYTEQETRRMLALRGKYGVAKPMPIPFKYVTHVPRLKGMPCYLSTRLLQISINGSIYRCQLTKRNIIGNISNVKSLANKRLFSDKPRLCPHETCSCKPRGSYYCLRPYRVTLAEYYREYYRKLGENASRKGLRSNGNALRKIGAQIIGEKRDEMLKAIENYCIHM